MQNTVLIIDQTSIPASFNCQSLFVNGKHILDADDSNEVEVEEIASALSKALDCSIENVEISEQELAYSVARKLNKLEEFDKDSDDLDDWVQGYTNDDILLALRDKKQAKPKDD